jgi:hypothetical protein
MKYALISPHGLKNAFSVDKRGHMDARISKGAIATIQVMTRVALVIAMGMILTVIGASIYGMLGTTH